ncbi:MAG: ATP cone domain-containing protein, partial [Candidatus Thiodiazotropha sp.]
MPLHALSQTFHLPRKVHKRDGSEADFDAGKIRNAILRAGQASGEFGDDEARLLTAQVMKVLTHIGQREGTPEIERI